MLINFADRLKTARKMKGWSLEELVSQMGEEAVSKQAISKYENGEMLPNEETLLHLSKALGIKVDYFYRKHYLSIEKVSFRKLDTYPAKMQDMVISSTQDFVERYLELEELIGIASKFNSKKYTQLKINGPEDIEKAAEFIRKEWKLGEGPIYNVIEMLEEQHIKVFEVDHDPDSFWGLSTIIPKRNIPVIVVNKNEKVKADRKRFTALHELGHIVMNLDHLPEKTQEQYCHHFAASMLIPKDRLIEEIGSEKRTKIYISELGQLKKQYGISISALLLRLRDCNIISANLCSTMLTEMKRQGIYKVEPEEYDFKGEETSHRFIQLLNRGVAMELFSTSKAAALNNQKLSDFRNQLK